MSRSDHATGQISTYRFPDEVSIDGLLVRPPLDADIDEIAPAFRDPAVGGEAGLPPVDADTLRVMLHEQLPGLHAQGLLAAYVIEDTETGKLLGGASLHHFDPLRDVVEIGYWLFVEARGLRRRDPGGAQADGARVPWRDLARRSACSSRQHGFRTSPRAARLRARGRQT